MFIMLSLKVDEWASSLFIVETTKSDSEIDAASIRNKVIRHWSADGTRPLKDNHD